MPPSSRKTRLKVKLVNLLLLSVSVVLGTTSGNTGLVVDGLASTKGVLQVLDLACIVYIDQLRTGMERAG